jgi:hypothetical protein
MTPRLAHSWPRVLSDPRRAAWLTLTVVGGLATPHAARSEPPPSAIAQAVAPPAIATTAPSAVREEDLLLFAVELDALTLTDSLAAYGAPEDPLIPLGELARLLDLDLDVSPAARRVTGRLGEAQRSVIIDLASGTARVAGKPIALAPEDVVVTASEIYFRASALQRLLPITLAIDTEALQIKIAALETLPIQARLERIARSRGTGANVESDEPTLKVATPYRLLSAPAFDVAVETGVSSLSSNTVRRYDVRIGGDLLYTGFQGYVGSDEHGEVSAVRATVERHRVGGGLLGPINATSVTAGDVFTPNLAIGARSVGGRGFAFTTAPLEQTSVFDRIDLRGELPIGYDVELYVNDILRSGQRTPVQGRYEFLAVPLVRGVNVIRIVSYGPRGERSETTKVVNVSGGQMKSHQTTFEFGVVQQERPLVAVRASASATDIVDVVSTAGRMRAVASLTHGLTQNLTLVAGAALYPAAADDDRQLYALGLRTSILGLATQFDAAGDDKGGVGLALGVAGRPFGVSVVGRHSIYSGGFIDEAYPAGDLTRQLKRHSELSVDGSLAFKDKILPLSGRLQHDLFTNGATNLLASSRASTTVANVLVSGGLDYERTHDTSAGLQQRLAGVFSASKFAGYTWQLRGALDYTLLPTPQLGSFSFTADRDLSEALAVRFGLGQSLGDSKTTSIQAGAIYRTRYGDLSLSGDYTTPTNDWRIGLQFAFGLVFDPTNRRYGLSRPGPATGGNVAFQAFVDRNGDGVFDTGDEPVTKVAVDGGEKKAVTGPDGRVFVTGLGVSPISRLQIGLDDIDNPYVQSPPRIVQFSPRAGQVLRIPYPLTPTGEVMAVVSLRKPDGKVVGLSAVHVRLVRGDNPPIEGSTEFDGSVSFEHLPVGTYRFELDPEQAARLRMRLKEPVTFKVVADGGFVPDVAAEVMFEPRPEPAATP